MTTNLSSHVSIEIGIDYPPRRSSSVSRLRLTPLRSEQKVDTPSFHEVKTIDLTGDRELFIPFSANEMAKPCRLWAGNDATKEQFGETRGKKRRSDEYMSNPPSPSENTYSARISTDEKSFEHSPNSNRVKTSNKAKPFSSSSLFPSKGHRKQSFVHCNEEDANTFMSDEDPIRRPRSSDIEALTSEKTKGTGRGRAERSPNGTRVVLSTKETQIQQAKSPKAPTASNGLEVCSSQPKDGVVSKFVALHSSSLGVIIRELKQTLQENSETVYWQAIKGQPSPDLIAENKSLASRIQAIEALQLQQARYRSRLLKKEKLKQCLIRLISQGLDPNTMPNELSQSRIAESDLKQTEREIWELLLEAKIFDLTKGLEMDSPTPESRDFHSDRHALVDQVQDAGCSKRLSPQKQDHPSPSPQVSRRDPVTSARQSVAVDTGEEERVARNMRSSTIELDDFEWSESEAETSEVLGSLGEDQQKSTIEKNNLK